MGGAPAATRAVAGRESCALTAARVAIMPAWLQSHSLTPARSAVPRSRWNSFEETTQRPPRRATCVDTECCAASSSPISIWRDWS
jgi:hypothetical protein